MVEKSLGACNDFLLLGTGDAGCGAAKILTVAQAYFSKNQKLLLAHDEVYFAKAAVIVRGDQGKALCFKKLAGMPLSGRSRGFRRKF